MLELRNIEKNYKIDKKPFEVLKKLNLSFDKKEFCAILGPSGCGKTTLLNIIGGLDRYDGGDLIIDDISTKTYTDKDWDNYRNKRIGFVFQSYNLIQHLSLLENVELALTLEGQSKKIRRQKAKKSLEIVGLGEFVNKKPNQLSGGQQQRVALARALINDPEIVLADEPTGALDSESSKEIMELLKEVAKTRLVIMVTHNKELADKYATRIVTMKDGVIKTDTKRINEFLNPTPKKEEKPKELEIIDESKKHKKVKKERTSMGFFTALYISLKNLFTKKGRTILTAIAGSFGIIGVALVLATSNGFTNYVERVESQTASTMPINLPAYMYTYEKKDIDYNPKRHPDEKEIYPVISTMGKPEVKYNNFSGKYINYLNKLRDKDKLLNDYIITYGDDYSLNLTSNFYDGTIKPIKNITTVNMAQMITNFTGLPMNMFHVLYGKEKYIRETYDLIDGSYPNNPNEIVLVLDAYNRLPPEVLKQLGFYDSTATEEEMLANPISFDDLYSKKFKVFNNDQFYKKTDTLNGVTDNYGNIIETSTFKNESYEKNFNDPSKGIELKVTGVLRPKKNTTFTLMSSGICYTKELEERLVVENSSAEIATSLKNNFVFNKLDSNGKAYKMGDFLDAFNKLTESSVNGSVLVSSINEIYDRFFTFYNYKNGLPYESHPGFTAVEQYLETCNSLGVDLISPEFKHRGITVQSIRNTLLGVIERVSKGNWDGVYESLISLIASINSYSTIQSIIVFPKDLTSKDKLLHKLDDYNNINKLDETDPNHAIDKSEQIFYMDFAGDFTKGMGQMIKIISIVLIIFASISLCVSCVMTGIITYVSVIERTKEIGILRALGARKKDVGRLFEAESCIIGLLSGIIGCLMAYFICIPINAIINHIYPEFNIGNIASLSFLHAIVLVSISVLLTFFSGLLPARMAAKKDPVNALRTE